MGRLAAGAIGAALLLAACGAPDGDPEAVVAAFWAAISERDLERARAHASRVSAASVDEWGEGYEIRSVSLGQTLRNQSAAVVETSLTTGDDDGDDAFELHPRFQTHLVLEDGAWRVDVTRTREDLDRAIIATAAARVRSALAEGAHEIGEALREGMDQLERALRGLESGAPAPPP